MTAVPSMLGSTAEVVNVRQATTEDVEALVAMGRRFLAQTAYRTMGAENPDQIRRLAHQLIDGEDSTVFVTDADGQPVGMIGLVLLTHPISGQRVAQEVVWWVEPDHRGRGLGLLRRAETWARVHGARHLHMIAPTAQVGRIYQRLGYTPVETLYQRSF